MQGAINVDLTSPRFKADPYPIYARLRSDAPVYRAVFQSTPLWLITRYNDATAMLKDTRLAKARPEDEARAEPAEAQARSVIFQLFTANMLTSDPPAHTRLRSLAHKAFMPRLTADLRARIQTIAGELVEAANGRGGMDIIKDYADPLSMRALLGVLGTPTEDQIKVQKWFRALAGAARNPREELVRELAPLLNGFLRYIRSLIEQRRQEPGSDLVSALVHAEDDGQRFTDDGIISMVTLLIIAGHDTTTNLIGNGTLALLRHPAELRRLNEDPSLIKPAIEEILRHDGPAEMTHPRRAREDIEIGGAIIPKGEMISVVLASANRDSAVFQDPEALDISRAENKHIAFGFGIHYCLGAALARIEAQIAISALLERAPNLRLANDPEALSWQPHLLVRGVKELPALF